MAPTDHNVIFIMAWSIIKYNVQFFASFIFFKDAHFLETFDND